MFLTLNKKKLKELSNSRIHNSVTFAVKGAGDTTLLPSKTSITRCVVEIAEKNTG